MKVNIIELIFFAVIVLTAFSQPSSNEPTLLVPGTRHSISFTSGKELYFYLPLLNYELFEESAVTLSLTSGDEGITPIIQAKCISTDKAPSELIQLMPSPPDSDFALNKRDKATFILYFKPKVKSTLPRKDYLLIRVNAIQSSVLLVLSHREEIVNLILLDPFEKRVITIEDNIPKHLTLINSIGANNYIVFIAKSKQKVFTGRLLRDDLSANPMQSEKSLFCLSYKDDKVKTIEFFGKGETIEVYIERVKHKVLYSENSRLSGYPRDISSEMVNEMIYYVEEKGSGSYWFALEAKYGRYEYYFKEEFSSDKALTTLLPSGEVHRNKGGFGKISNEYYIIGIKAISPGIATIHYITPSKNDILYVNAINESTLLLTKDSKYTIRLPTAADVSIAFTPLYIEDSNSALTIRHSNSNYSLKANSSVFLRGTTNDPISIDAVSSNAVIVFRSMKGDSFTEVNTGKYTINSRQLVYYPLNNLQAKSFSFRLDRDVKEITYSIGIGRKGEKVFPLPRTPLQVEKDSTFLTITNPNHQYASMLSQEEAYYFTLINNNQTEAFTIEIETQNITQSDYFPMKLLSSISPGAIYSLQYNKPSAPQSSLVLIGLLCDTSANHSLSLSYKKQQIRELSIRSQFSFVEVNDSAVPLDFEYFTKSPRSSDALLLSYAYLTPTEKQQMKDLDKHQNSLISNKTNTVRWTSPLNSTKAFMVYYAAKGKNASALDDECFLRESEGILVQNATQFSFNRSFSGGEYYVSVVTIGNDKIQYRYSYAPIVITVSHFWFWFWIGLASFFVLMIIIAAGVIIFFRGKRKTFDDEVKDIEPFMEKEFNDSKFI